MQNHHIPLGRRHKRLLLIALLTLTLTGCAAGQVKNEARPDAGWSAAGARLGGDTRVDAAVRSDFDMALRLLKSGQTDKAMELLASIIQRTPRTTAPYINLAIAQQDTGNLEAAEENLKKALAIEPNHPVANNEYGILYRRTGRLTEARETYEAILSNYPGFILARRNLAILCDLYMNDFDCALKNYQIYREATPSDQTVDIWIADVKARSGR